MTPICGLLLDFYGTLVWEDDDIVAAIRDDILATATRETTSAAIGQSWWGRFSWMMTEAHAEAFIPQRELARRSLAATIAETGSTLDPAKLVVRQFAHWTAPRVFPETAEFLSMLDDLGLPFCVVSNIDREDVKQAIAACGVHVEHLVTSDDAKSYKPRPEMFQQALARLGLEPGQVLHVGDSRTSDVAGATALGIPVAWINRTGKAIDSGSLPTYTIANLMDVLALIEPSRS